MGSTTRSGRRGLLGSGLRRQKGTIRRAKWEWKWQTLGRPYRRGYFSHRRYRRRQDTCKFDSPTPSYRDGNLTAQVPRSPISNYRASLPPPFQHTFQNYQASPLQQALTPPSYEQGLADAFPSVESGDSGDNFHMHAGGLSDSSPSFTQGPEIYCAACQSVSILKQSFACTECICGLCPRCVDVLMGEQGARRKCPRCGTVGGRFKPFQLDIR